MTTFLLAIHIIVTLLLAFFILIQKSEGGLGLGGGANMSLFSARGAANFLTHATAFLAALFLGNCILMSSLTNSRIHHTQSFLEDGTKSNPNEQAESPVDIQKEGQDAQQTPSETQQGHAEVSADTPQEQTNHEEGTNPQNVNQHHEQTLNQEALNAQQNAQKPTHKEHQQEGAEVPSPLKKQEPITVEQSTAQTTP